MNAYGQALTDINAGNPIVERVTVPYGPTSAGRPQQYSASTPSPVANFKQPFSVPISCTVEAVQCLELNPSSYLHKVLKLLHFSVHVGSSMIDSDPLPSLLFKINENQLALEAAIMELTNWVEKRGAVDVAGNIRAALVAIDRNEEFIKMTLAVMLTSE